MQCATFCYDHVSRGETKGTSRSPNLVASRPALRELSIRSWSSLAGGITTPHCAQSLTHGASRFQGRLAMFESLMCANILDSTISSTNRQITLSLARKNRHRRYNACTSQDAARNAITMHNECKNIDEHQWGNLRNDKGQSVTEVM